jgi:hypothetical protein
MISVLLLTMQKGYGDINERLRAMQDRRYFLKRESTKSALRYLKTYYWDITELVERASGCFGVDFFFAGVCSTVRFIYFLFLTLKYMAEKKVIDDAGGFVLPSSQSIVFFVAVVGKFYYLCYRCDSVVSEVGLNVDTM